MSEPMSVLLRHREQSIGYSVCIRTDADPLGHWDVAYYQGCSIDRQRWPCEAVQMARRAIIPAPTVAERYALERLEFRIRMSDKVAATVRVPDLRVALDLAHRALPAPAPTDAERAALDQAAFKEWFERFFEGTTERFRRGVPDYLDDAFLAGADYARRGVGGARAAGGE